MRRQFQMPTDDVKLLDASGLTWEAVKDGATMWLILHEYALPPGYNHPTARAAFRIHPSYPDVQVDMVYFHPALALTSGKPIRALSATNIDGALYQQWSRHRTAQNPWRPGLDNIGTHLVLVKDWLQKELGG